MKRFRLVSVSVSAAIAVGLVSVVPAASDPGAEASGSKFKPKKIAGSWKGNWKNQTFGSKGAASMKIKAKGKKLTGTFDLGGNAFGCADPAPRKVTLTKGRGNNRWNSKGLKAVWKNGFGTNTLKMKVKGKKLKVSGKGTSPCTSQITYSYKGAIKKYKTLTADTEILNNGAKFANSTLKLNKR